MTKSLKIEIQNLQPERALGKAFSKQVMERIGIVEKQRMFLSGVKAAFGCSFLILSLVVLSVIVYDLVSAGFFAFFWRFDLYFSAIGAELLFSTTSWLSVLILLLIVFSGREVLNNLKCKYQNLK